MSLPELPPLLKRTPAGTEIVFTVTGSLEFFNDDDSLASVWDCFSFVNLYSQYCKSHGMVENPRLFY